MKLAANAYAIGPSLYDWERDRWEEQAIRRDARDAAFDDHYDLWRRFAYCDREKKKGAEEIAEVMDTALNNLYCNDQDCAKFEFALFVWYCSDNEPDARNLMNELLDRYIRAVIRKEWEREQEAA